MSPNLARAQDFIAPPSPAAIAAARPRHLLHVMPSFAVGGIQIRLARLINEFGTRFRHSIIALDGETACRDRLDPRLDVEIATARSGAGLFARLAACRNAIAAARPDLLLTYNWGAIEWAMANRIFRICRHVHAEDGFGPAEAKRQLRRRIILRRWALGGAEAVIVPSHTLESIALTQWRVAPERLRYIPNGIDAAGFRHGRDLPPLFERRADEIVIGTVAPLRAEKNIARLIRAFAQAETTAPLRLAIAGDGPERKNLATLADELGLAERVLFLGPVREPRRALALFDVFALSSDTEQMPMNLLEAMAMGLPVAALDVGDVRQMVAPANRGFIADAGDDAGFARALAGLAGDAGRRSQLGRLNQGHVEAAYPWPRMVESYARIFAGRL